MGNFVTVSSSGRYNQVITVVDHIVKYFLIINPFNNGIQFFYILMMRAQQFSFFLC